jgi:hypothetical protein
VIRGNDDAIRSAQLMCRVIADAVTEGGEIARRRGARPGTRSEEVTPAAPVKPQRTPEEQAEFDRRQSEARDAAAAKQREIEERARLAKDAAKSAEPVGAEPDGAAADVAEPVAEQVVGDNVGTEEAAGDDDGGDESLTEAASATTDEG